MPIEMPQKARQIMDTLKRNGFDAYAVGGCVRDSLLGVDPHDWDICTSATPKQMIRCFEKWHVIETGIQHGTITVIIDSEPFEVTTYRIDGAYLDNRHPEEVIFVDSLIEDLARRDFTINAMAYSNEKGLADPFEGQKDLALKRIRCVGDADKRFHEDALRIIRALRFASVFEFEIEQSTSDSIHHNKALLKNIASERINVEFCKLICGSGAENILRDYTDVIAVFIPEIELLIGFEQDNAFHCYNVWEHTIKSISHAPKETILRLTMLFHDMAKPMCFSSDENGIGHFYGHPVQSTDIADKIMKRLKFDNNTTETVKTLVLYHDVELQPKSAAVKKLLNKIGPENLELLLSVKTADYSAQSLEYLSQRELILNNFRNKMKKVLEDQQCFKLRDLVVDGKDLIGIGIPQGVKIGKVLNALLDLVINDQLENEREKLLNKARSMNSNKSDVDKAI